MLNLGEYEDCIKIADHTLKRHPGNLLSLTSKVKALFALNKFNEWQLTIVYPNLIHDITVIHATLIHDINESNLPNFNFQPMCYTELVANVPITGINTTYSW